MLMLAVIVEIVASGVVHVHLVGLRSVQLVQEVERRLVGHGSTLHLTASCLDKDGPGLPLTF